MRAKKEALDFREDLPNVMSWLPTKAQRDYVSLLFPPLGAVRDIPGYIRLWRKTHQIDRINSRVMLPVVGMEIDLCNIVWMYRLKKYYSTEPNLIYSFLIPVSYRLRKGDAAALAECASLADFLEAVAAGPYGKVFDTDFAAPEGCLASYLRKTIRATERNAPDTPAAVIGYLFDKDREAGRITAVIEGVRYGLAPAEIHRRAS
jgi:V/A-type H+-transporting ATPase subunit C